MKLGITGLLLTLAGGILIAAGWFYFEFSLWLMVPGVIAIMLGSSLVSGYRASVTATEKHRISDRFDHKEE